MVRKLFHLSELDIENALPGTTANTPRLLADGGGLYLQITPSGTKSFLFRYTFSGKAQTMGLGPAHTVKLSEARETAQQYRGMVLKGIDPRAERETQKLRQDAVNGQTFQQCAERYITAHKAEWENEKHAYQWNQSLGTYVFPKMGRVLVRDIDVHHVLQVLEPIWQTKTETATRIRGRIERVLGWATVKGFRSGENPARWKSFLSELLPKPGKIAKVTHHPAIPHAEIAAFLMGLRKQPDSFGVRALEFLILTAARTGEVIGARWSEFDLTKNIWTVPKERMKSRRPHVVPLSQRAVEILTSIPHYKGETIVFRGRAAKTSISNMAMIQVMRRMDLKEVPHGMRSSFRDWVADKTDYPRELAEVALAHVVGDATEAAYLRSDRLVKRRIMMEAWAKYCLDHSSVTPSLLAKYTRKASLKTRKTTPAGVQRRPKKSLPGKVI